MMTRSGFFKSVAVFFCVRAGRAAVKKPKLVAVADAHYENLPRADVFLDGVNVSKACYRAEQYDDGTLVVYGYLKDQDGRFVTERGEDGKYTTVQTVRVGRGYFEFKVSTDQQLARRLSWNPVGIHILKPGQTLTRIPNLPTSESATR